MSFQGAEAPGRAVRLRRGGARARAVMVPRSDVDVGIAWLEAREPARGTAGRGDQAVAEVVAELPDPGLEPVGCVSGAFCSGGVTRDGLGPLVRPRKVRGLVF